MTEPVTEPVTGDVDVDDTNWAGAAWVNWGSFAAGFALGVLLVGAVVAFTLWTGGH